MTKTLERPFTLTPKTIELLEAIKVLLDQDHAPAPKLLSGPVARAITHLEQGRCNPHRYFKCIFEKVEEYGKYRPSQNAILSAQTSETQREALRKVTRATQSFQAIAAEMQLYNWDNLETENLFTYTVA